MPVSCGVVRSGLRPSPRLQFLILQSTNYIFTSFREKFFLPRRVGVAAIIRKIMPQTLRSGSCSFRPFQRWGSQRRERSHPISCLPSQSNPTSPNGPSPTGEVGKETKATRHPPAIDCRLTGEDTLYRTSVRRCFCSS